MTNAWDQAASLADKHANQGGLFVKLANDGDKVVGAFVGDPHAREVVWTGDAYEPYEEGGAAHQGKRPSLKVMLNFYVPGDGMKVIELNATTFGSLLQVRDKYGLGWLYEITRSGKPRDPKTKYTILPERELDAGLAAEIRGASLHDLASFGSGEEGDAGDGVVSETEAERMAAALRRLPRSAVDAFLGELRVQRIRDVRASDAERARALLADLAKRHAPPPAEEVDPFA